MPPVTWTEGEGDATATKEQICQSADLKEKGRQIQKPVIVCVFSCFCRSPTVRMGRGEGDDPDLLAWWSSPAVARGPTRRQWRWRVGGRAAMNFCNSRRVPLQFLEFWGLFCKIWIIWCSFYLFLNIIICIVDVKKGEKEKRKKKEKRRNKKKKKKNKRRKNIIKNVCLCLFFYYVIKK